MSGEDVQYYLTCAVGSITAFSLFKVIQSSLQIHRNNKLIHRISNAVVKYADDEFLPGETVIVKVIFILPRALSRGIPTILGMML